MEKDQIKTLIEKSLLFIISGFFLLFWLMLHNSNVMVNSKHIAFHFNNSLPVLIVALITFFIVIKDKFNSSIEQAKLEQKNKDYGIVVKYMEMKIQNLTTKYDLAEEKANALIAKMKYLGQLTDVPDLALYLMEKILNIMEDYKTELKIQVTGNLKALKTITISDLKQTLDLMMMPICENFKNIEVENRGDINLFIREQNSKIIFKVMHDYVSDPINTEMITWNVRKILQKYGGNFTVENEQEDEMFVLSLTMDVPKEVRARKIV